MEASQQAVKQGDFPLAAGVEHTKSDDTKLAGMQIRANGPALVAEI